MKRAILLVAVLGTAACGSSAKSAPPSTVAESPPPKDISEPAAAVGSPPPAAEPQAATEPAPSEPPATTSTTTTTTTAATPPKIEFPPHASVEQAIDAVPRGLPRLNMSNDSLEAPLVKIDRYDKCKVPRSTKVTMGVAVYDGRAVGVDVTTKPKSSKLEACIDEVVRALTWDKVPSLNQVNVTF
jgi:hypothetical protein